MQSEDPVAEQLASMIAPSRTALLVIDVQTDFVGPTGAARHWTRDFARFDRPLGNIEALIQAARKAGVPPIFLRVITRPETDSTALKLFHRRKGDSPESLALCRAGTEGADYHRIRPGAGDIEIEKRLYSGFVGTDLETTLRRLGADTLVLAGFTTDCCVDSTTRDAFHRNYNVFVVGDACGSYEDTLHAGTLAALAQNFALVVDAQAVVEAWS